MKKNIFFININEKILILFLFLFSLLINQYYGNQGIFPPDSFAHFDSGYRILNGEYPFKDYWLVSGPFGDYLQAVLFYFFGINWQIYILQASFINAVLTFVTFLIFRSFKLNIYYSFFYSILFSILAYPSSGTPFVDHSSALFSLLGIYFLILGIKSEKKIYWILLPVFLGISFFSKLVPSSYIIISTLIILFFFSISTKKYYWIKYSFLGFIFFIFFLLVIGYAQGITLLSFIEQYIFFPKTIGEHRFDNFNFTFRGIIAHYKFIYIFLIPIFYINLKKMLFEKNFLKEKDFFYFFCILLLTFSLIFHQLLTKNQTFIFFLIPILAGFCHINFNRYKSNLKNIVYITILAICIFATAKYHIRFNEERKFHELNQVNIKFSSDGSVIDEKLSGLKWITPYFNGSPDEEISLINEALSYLKKDTRNKMVMTHYLFFSTILEQKTFSPSRWILQDGTTHPLKGSKYFNSYKNFYLNIIKKNNIKVIYTVNPIAKANVYDYISDNCYSKKKVTQILYKYELQKCDEISN